MKNKKSIIILAVVLLLNLIVLILVLTDNLQNKYLNNHPLIIGLLFIVIAGFLRDEIKKAKRQNI